MPRLHRALPHSSRRKSPADQTKKFILIPKSLFVSFAPAPSYSSLERWEGWDEAEKRITNYHFMLSLLYTKAFWGRDMPIAGFAAASSAGAQAHSPKCSWRPGVCLCWEDQLHHRSSCCSSGVRRKPHCQCSSSQTHHSPLVRPETPYPTICNEGLWSLLPILHPPQEEGVCFCTRRDRR